MKPDDLAGDGRGGSVGRARKSNKGMTHLYDPEAEGTFVIAACCLPVRILLLEL